MASQNLTSRHRYVLLGTPDQKHPSLGLHTSMPFKKSGFSAPPLPMAFQFNKSEDAMTFKALMQPWVTENYNLSPTKLLDSMFSSKEFHVVVGSFAQRDSLYDSKIWWAVKYGTRAGVYQSTKEAMKTIGSSDLDHQRGYAFRTLAAAIQASAGSSDRPADALFDLNPKERDEEAKDFLALVSADDILPEQFVPGSQIPSRTASQATSSAIPTAPGAVGDRIIVAPFVINHAGEVSRVGRDGIAWAVRFLQVIGFGEEDVQQAFHCLHVAPARDEFMATVCEDFPDGLTERQAGHMWDLIHTM